MDGWIDGRMDGWMNDIHVHANIASAVYFMLYLDTCINITLYILVCFQTTPIFYSKVDCQL